jgi:hypothetical protein
MPLPALAMNPPGPARAGRTRILLIPVLPCAPHPPAPLQERFDVDIKPLPSEIDASTYMNQA